MHHLLILRHLLVALVILLSCSKRSGEIVVVADNVDYFSWSSDAMYLVYSSSNAEATEKQPYWTGVYIKHVSTDSNPISFIGGDTSVFGLDLSPGGDAVAICSRINDISSYIWIFPKNRKTRPVQVTSGVFDDENLKFSPDGKRIAFQSNRYGKETSLICIVSLNDGSLNILNDSLLSICHSPSWHPDGNKIAFTRLSGQTGYDIYQIDLTNNNILPIIASPLDEYLGSYSPDGNSIIYFKYAKKKPAIYIKNLISGKEKVIIEPNLLPVPLHPPLISPDNKKIAFLTFNQKEKIIKLVYVKLNKEELQDNENK